MSWTHVASATDGTSGSVASRSIALPVGTAADDLAVVVATVNDGATASATIEATPSGWNVAGSNPENGASNTFLSSVCYWKVLTQADVDLASVTVNFSGFRSHGLSISVWRADGDISLDGAAVVTKDISDGNPTPSTIPGLTLAQTNELVVIAFSASQSTAVYAFTQTLRTSGVFGTRNTAIAADVVASSGATGALNASIQNDFYGRIVFALAFIEASVAPPSEVSPAKTESYEVMDWDSIEETTSSVGETYDRGYTNETWETR